MFNLNLKKKSFIVTGGKGFIGKSIIKDLLGEGANIIATDHKNSSLINIKIIKNKKYSYFNLDLSKKDKIDEFAKNLKNIKIDGIINCAAITSDYLNEKNQLNSFDTYFKKVQTVNVDCFIYLFKKLFKNFKKNSSIVQISSIYSFLAPNKNLYTNSKIFNSLPYSISKASINQITRWFASKYAPNIRFNCVSAGGLSRNQDKIFLNKYKKLTPLKRLANEQDVSSIVLFLLSSKSSYITGQSIVVDGGFSII